MESSFNSMEINYKLILEAFQIESEENLQMLEETLLALETAPDDQENLQAIFRAAHTIKGGAGSLGLNRLAEFTHVMEDLLDRVRKRTLSVTAPLISLLLESVDTLREMVPAAVAGEEELTARQQALMQKFADTLRNNGVEPAGHEVAQQSAALSHQTPEVVPEVAYEVAYETAPETAHETTSELASEATPTNSATEMESSTGSHDQVLADQQIAGFNDPTDNKVSDHNGQIAPSKKPLARTKSKDLETNASDRPAPEKAAEHHVNKSASARTLRVDIDKLDRMMNLIGEIAIARGRFKQMMEDMKDRIGEDLLEVHHESDRLYMEIQEQVMKLRMVPIEPFFRQFVRTVRDVSSTLNKQAELVIESGDVEVDTTVIEHLKDPIMHMVRNALDHGIEIPEKRTALGKDVCGQLTLRAYHDAGNIVIQLADNGAGFNKEKILARAIARGLISESDKLSDSDIYKMVFESGFSTAENVTDISGRGVGMDVVTRNIETIRGTVHIESRANEGSTITIRLPLTLAIIDGFSVGVGEETYVIPLDAVTECLTLPQEHLKGNARGVMNLRDKALPYIRLRDFFKLDGEAPPRENIVVVQQNGQHTGFVVDALYGESQAVIKPLNKLFQELPGISGSTILGSGRVALILDIPSLLQGISSSFSASI